jgi:DNA-binding Xre family transcriptional regulator
MQTFVKRRDAFDRMMTLAAKDRHVSQDQLAKSAGLCRQTWRKYREHPGTMPICTLEAVCRFLHMTEEETLAVYKAAREGAML